jgi:hypothetical protein
MAETQRTASRAHARLGHPHASGVQGEVGQGLRNESSLGTSA